jgi:simple sugar transport system ATP-binding protein
VLVFDEPTAVLTPQEIDELMLIMKNMADEGKSIIFITHKLDEIKKAADRCTILRKGKYIATVDVDEVSKEELSRMMVGRDVSLKVDKKEIIELGEDVLTVKDICVKSGRSHKNAVANVSFNVRAGEIVCIAGVEGNGQTDIVQAVTGLTHVLSGKIFLQGKEITKSTVRERSLLGMSHIPEDRHKYGLILDYQLVENIVLQSYFKRQFSKFLFLNFANIASYAKALIEKFDIRTSMGAKTRARYLSGGNQQKAIIAREISKEHSLLVAVQPTRGLDVGAIEYIHSQLIAERENGKAVLLVSLELDEVMNISDRILVISKGEIVGEFKPDQVTAEELGLYMAGAKRREATDV